MADIERLEEVLAFIESHPELHNQTQWFTTNWLRADYAALPSGLGARYPELTRTECGSTGCLAGWAVYFWDDKNREKNLGDWALRGREVLGLTIEESVILFHPRNTVDTLRQMVKDLANGLDLEKAWEEKTDTGRPWDVEVYRPYYQRKADV